MTEKKKIAIVEDHAIVRRALETWFNETGRWNVIGTASSLKEARAVLPGLAADIILLDMNLEDGIGLEIISSFAKQSSIAQQKPLFAVYTGFDSHTHASAALSLGVRAYVTKRKTEIELEQYLLRALEGEICIDETARIKIQTSSDLVDLLTRREAEILIHVKKGLSNRQIADHFGISHRTVENILSLVYDKTGIHNRLELEKL
ncbi:MAG: response regulator transcription factor [Treponema sp.]|nr:response regulator transcription factor [Treponema sp.]